MIAVTSSLLIAYKTGGRDRRLLLLADKFPSDASIASVVQVFEFHLPLNFAYQGAIRLASSREPGELAQKHRQEAYNQLTLDLLPAMVVAFKLLGSHEYAKLVMTYIVMLDYWVKKRPDLIQIFMTNLGATLNEEPIENVHAHVSQNFSSVTMGTADYVHTSAECETVSLHSISSFELGSVRVARVRSQWSAHLVRARVLVLPTSLTSTPERI